LSAVAATLAVALVGGLAGRTTSARADAVSTGTVNYELTSDTNIAPPSDAGSGPQVIFNVLPPGAIVPPTGADGKPGSPLTILDSSSGFDQDHLIVALKNVPGSDGNPDQQLFGLSFLGQGLASAANGGKLDFSLSVDSTLGTPTLTSDTPGIHVAELPPPTPPVTSPETQVTATSAPPPRQPPGSADAIVPEPMSVALWSVLLAAGLGHLRAARRKID
jgi:hypothetical protein